MGATIQEPARHTRATQDNGGSRLSFMILNLCQGSKTSSKCIQRFMTKTQIYNVCEHTLVTLAYAKECKHQAFIDYIEAHKEATAWQSTFQDSLMAA
jgi:hypothetical protein